MQNDYQKDIKQGKVKQGYMTKQSRHLKQWRQRWMVLTKSFLYSFTQKGIYKEPTQVIPLKDVTTLKVYYKQQYVKPHVFRIQTPSIHFYLAGKSKQQKLAWISAIERTISRISEPQEDNFNAIIRETLKKSKNFDIAQMMTQSTKESSLDQNQSPASFKKSKQSAKKLQLVNQTTKFSIIPNSNGRKSTALNLLQQRQSMAANKHGEMPFKLQSEIKIQKIIQEKIIQKQKIVYVPRIQQKIVEKIVYVNGQSSGGSSSQLASFFEDVIANSQNPKSVVDLIIIILTNSKFQRYQKSCTSIIMGKQRRFFQELFLKMLNQESQQNKLNNYIQFLTSIYQISDEYLYSSDVKVLLDIVLRHLQINISNLNQYLYLNLLLVLTEKSWWKKLSHRVQQLRSLTKQLDSISPPDTKLLISQLLPRL